MSSSELIGELGQVGLKIDESVGLNRSNDCYSDDEKRRGRCSSAYRPKKFRQAWMNYDIFKDWLRPHSNPELATCITCNRVFKAGKSELEKHAAGKRHQLLRGGGQQLHPASQASPVTYSQQDLISTGLSVSVNISGDSNTMSGGERSQNSVTKIEDCAGVTFMETTAFETSFTGDGGGGENYTQGGGGGGSGGGEGGPGLHGGGLQQTSAPAAGGPPSHPRLLHPQQPQPQQQNSAQQPPLHHLPAGAASPPASPPRPLLQSAAPSTISKAIVGRSAPPWRATAIVNGHVTKLDLSDYKGRYLILFFYPQDFNRVCASEVNRLSERVAEFRASGCEVVACSVDSHLAHLAWAKLPRAEGGVGNPKLPLLSDPTHSIATDYGVLDPERGHTLRGTFLIDRRGRLRAMSIYDQLLGRGIDELLRSVQALAFSDENEEPVPSDWSPATHALQCKSKLFLLVFLFSACPNFDGSPPHFPEF